MLGGTTYEKERDPNQHHFENATKLMDVLADDGLNARKETSNQRILAGGNLSTNQMLLT